MIQWKERLYAFLIRRFVGPWLDEESSHRLYQSIDISLQEGIFVLRNVSLATRKLTALLGQPLRIRKATVGKLEIHLHLQEHQQISSEDDPPAAATTSSLAWRAWKLGTDHTHGAVSLVVTVVVEDICIEIEPADEVIRQTSSNTTSTTSTAPSTEEPATSKGMFSSYMEAVLASLRLSLEVRDLEVKLYAPNKATATDDVVSLRIQSLSYHDINQSNSGPTDDREYETIMQKAVDVQRVSVVVGVEKDQDRISSTMVALVDGSSRFRLRVIEYRPVNNSAFSSSTAPNPIQHDAEISLEQKLNLLIDEGTLSSLQRIITTYKTSFQKAVVETMDEEVVPAYVATREPTEDDRRQAEEDMETLDGIMRQYNEARRLAERKELRGGILVPDEGDSNNMTYDVFFDANDQSIYRYSTLMSHCAAGSNHQSTDFVHFKGRFFLNSGSVKLAFGKKEYLLATFSDLNANASLSTMVSTMSFSLVQLDIEESFVTQGKPDMRPRIEISRVLHFLTLEGPVDSDQSDQGELLITSPCITMELRSEKKANSTQVALNLEPIQLSCHPTTISNLALFTNCFAAPDEDSKNEESDNFSHPESIATKKGLAVSLSCPSIDIFLPLKTEDRLDIIFERCGYISEYSPLAPSPAVGVCIDSLCLNYDDKAYQRGKSVCITAKHLLLHVSSPLRKTSRQNQRRVVDLLCLSESSEQLMLTIHFDEDNDLSETNHAMKSFPLAPSVASFKARQEDEDEENQIDRVLISKMGNLGLAAKRELRGNDPQKEMLQNCKKCNISVAVRAPHLFFDSSIDEYFALSDALTELWETPKGHSNKDTNKSKQSQSSISFGVEIDHVSLGLHFGRGLSELSNELDHSFISKLNQLRIHTVLGNSGIKHIRLSAEELDFFEAAKLLGGTTVKDPRSSESRSTAVFQRIRCSDTSARPIFYRSHLFKPLSRDNPCILFDFLFQPDESASNESASRQSIHCTLYDITFRHSDESAWIEHLKHVSMRLFPTKNDGAESSNSGPGESLTRVFVAIVDCNLDYSTPCRFKNEARFLLRLGDVRCSSNVVLPAPAIQAYNLSIADLSLYLCNHRHPYNFENSLLIDSVMLFVERDRKHAFRDGSEAVKSVNYRAMVLLDTVDAIIAVANQRKKNIPRLYASLTVGELSLYGSKDSFWLFIQSVGEAVGEATAMTDKQIKDIKEQMLEQYEDEDTFFDTMVEAEDDESETKQPAYVNALDNLKKQSALRPAIGTKSSESQKHQFLLDGYDWTTIDQAEPAEKKIANDEEQSARWYPRETVASGSADSQFAVVAGPGVSFNEKASDPLVHPVRIIPHHFPLRPDSDPLADGDMGAAKYAGTGSSPLVSNRILVHDMKVKLRFFDGYDWPELLSPEALNRERKDSFLIDALETSEKEESTKETKTPESSKAKLMADLLGSPSELPGTFKDAPLPEDKGARLAKMAQCRRLARRTGKYFQISASGISLRNDSFQLPSNHRLASCLNLKAQDFFIAETISGNKPLKMVGEWFSEDDHPRDSRHGLLMMKVSFSYYLRVG